MLSVSIRKFANQSTELMIIG